MVDCRRGRMKECARGGDTVKFNLIVFGVAFAFSFVVDAISNSSILVDRVLSLSSEKFVWAVYFINVVSFIVSPFLLFASFYLIGRDIDLASDFLSVLVPLFLGSWAGHLIGYFSLAFCYMSLYAGPYFAPTALLQFLWTGWTGFTMAFSLEFFVGFTALAIAYIVKKR